MSTTVLSRGHLPVADVLLKLVHDASRRLNSRCVSGIINLCSSCPSFMMIDLPTQYPAVSDVQHRIHIWTEKYLWNNPVTGGRSTRIFYWSKKRMFNCNWMFKSKSTLLQTRTRDGNITVLGGRVRQYVWLQCIIETWFKIAQKQLFANMYNRL